MLSKCDLTLVFSSFEVDVLATFLAIIKCFTNELNGASNIKYVNKEAIIEIIIVPQDIKSLS